MISLMSSLRRNAAVFALALSALFAAFPLRADWKTLLKKTSDSLDKKRAEKRAKQSRSTKQSVAAVRGIGCEPAEVDKAADNSEARDFDALEKLLSSLPSDDAVEAFVKEGGLR